MMKQGIAVLVVGCVLHFCTVAGAAMVTSTADFEGLFDHTRVSFHNSLNAEYHGFMWSNFYVSHRTAINNTVKAGIVSGDWATHTKLSSAKSTIRSADGTPFTAVGAYVVGAYEAGPLPLYAEGKLGDTVIISKMWSINGSTNVAGGTKWIDINWAGITELVLWSGYYDPNYPTAFRWKHFSMDNFTYSRVVADPTSRMPVPLPGSVVLLGVSGLGLAGFRARKKQKVGTTA